MSKRLRVLLIAEAANPEMVSVPLIGWHHARAVSRVTDAHLVTQIRNQDAITRAGLIEGRDFTAIDSEAVVRTLRALTRPFRGGNDKGWTFATAAGTLANYQFERLIWKQFGRRIASKEFDVVHRVTPVSPVTPSPLAVRCRGAGVPFVLGPINGGVPWPTQFRDLQAREREWLSKLRSAHKLLPGYHKTREAASAILVGSKTTLEGVDLRYQDKCVYLPENAIDQARFTARRTRSAVRPIRVVFVGRLVPLKAVDMLIEAAAPLVRRGDVIVDVIGDGPVRADLQRLASALGVEGGVRLDGWVEHTGVQMRLAEADVLGFPSVREFGGGAVLEAMAVGLVPVVVNYGGPAELVTDRVGFRIDMGDRGKMIEELRAVLERLVRDPELIERKGRAAMEYVWENFTWDSKAAQVLEVYKWVLGHRSKPEFGMPLGNCGSDRDAMDRALAAAVVGADHD